MALHLKGEAIVCPNGHACGSLLQATQNDVFITEKMFELELFDKADRAPSDDGHVCKRCGKRITEFHGHGVYRVLTASGWAGSIP